MTFSPSTRPKSSATWPSEAESSFDVEHENFEDDPGRRLSEHRWRSRWRSRRRRLAVGGVRQAVVGRVRIDGVDEHRRGVVRAVREKDRERFLDQAVAGQVENLHRQVVEGAAVEGKTFGAESVQVGQDRPFPVDRDGELGDELGGIAGRRDARVQHQGEAGAGMPTSIRFKLTSLGL